MPRFPSPCGDELFLGAEHAFARLFEFPSPCGDELFRSSFSSLVAPRGFRPLAGMNCFILDVFEACAKLFPSPCGDELFPIRKIINRETLDVSVPLRG